MTFAKESFNSCIESQTMVRLLKPAPYKITEDAKNI